VKPGFAPKRLIASYVRPAVKKISCHALLIATGVTVRRLEAAGVKALTGAGEGSISVAVVHQYPRTV